VEGWLVSGPPSLLRRYGTTLAWLANRSSFIKEGAHRRAFGAMVGDLRLNHERRLVAQIFPRWNRLQPWFALAEALRTAAWSAGSMIYAAVASLLTAGSLW